MFVAKFSIYRSLSPDSSLNWRVKYTHFADEQQQGKPKNRGNPKIVARNVLKGLDESAAGDRNVVYGDDRLN